MIKKLAIFSLAVLSSKLYCPVDRYDQVYYNGQWINNSDFNMIMENNRRAYDKTLSDKKDQSRPVVRPTNRTTPRRSVNPVSTRAQEKTQTNSVRKSTYYKRSSGHRYPKKRLPYGYYNSNNSTNSQLTPAQRKKQMAEQQEAINQGGYTRFASQVK